MAARMCPRKTSRHLPRRCCDIASRQTLRRKAKALRPTRLSSVWSAKLRTRKATCRVTHDLERFLRPEEIARISRLELRARKVVEGFVSGLHRSPYFGQSLEFVQPIKSVLSLSRKFLKIPSSFFKSRPREAWLQKHCGQFRVVSTNSVPSWTPLVLKKIICVLCHELVLCSCWNKIVVSQFFQNNSIFFKPKISVLVP